MLNITNLIIETVKYISVLFTVNGGTLPNPTNSRVVDGGVYPFTPNENTIDGGHV